MHRSVLVLLLSGALLVGALPAVAAPGKGQSTERQEDREDRQDEGSGQDRGRSGRNASEDEDDDRGRSDDRPVPPSVGNFFTEGTHAQGTSTGKHVTFSYNETGVANFTAEGVTLFNVTVLGERDEGGQPRVTGEGSEVDIRNSAYKLKAHDIRPSVFTVDTEGRILFSFGEGVVLSRDGEHGGVEFTVGGVTGYVTGKRLSLQNMTIAADDRVHVRVVPPGSASDDQKAIHRAIGKGHLGAEAVITPSTFEGELLQDVVSYGNVTMTTLKAEKGNLTLAIEGHGTEGRVVALNVDGRVVGAQKREDLTITLDNLSIAEASTLADVLDPDDDGYTPEYYVVFDPSTESFQLLVSVPHYSVHILSVGTVLIPVPPPVVFGVVAGVAVLVPSAWLLFRRKDE